MSSPSPAALPWSLRLIRGALYLLCFVLPFAKAGIEISFGLMLIGWLWLVVQRRQHKQAWWTLPATITWPLVAYLALCAGSILTSTYPGHSLNGFINKTLEYALLLIIVADVAHEGSVARRALGVVCASAALIVLDAWIQEATGRDLLLGHQVGRTLPYDRMTGPYDNPNDLATFFMVMLPITIVAVRSLVRWRWWVAGLLPPLAAAFVRVDSQGAWLGLVVGFILLVRLVRAIRTPIVVGMGLALVAAAWAWHLHPSYVQAIGPGPADRLVMWGATWKMVCAHPWTGVGLNTFMANYLDYWVGGERMPRYAHNCYLQTAAELGVPGLIAFVWLLGALLVFWWRRFTVMASERDRVHLAGLMAAALAFLVQSAMDTNFYSLRQVTLFWVVAGLATGLSLSETASAPAPDADLAAVGSS